MKVTVEELDRILDEEGVGQPKPELEAPKVERRGGKPSFVAGDSKRGKELSERRWAKHRAEKAEREQVAKVDREAALVLERQEDARIGRETLRRLAQNTQIKPEVRARAAELLLAYGEGKPKETIEKTGTQTLNVVLSPKMMQAHAQNTLPPAAA